MWAYAQRDGRSVEYNVQRRKVCLTPTARVLTLCCAVTLQRRETR